MMNEQTRIKTKSLVFLLILVLSSICSATQYKPVIVRDKFTASGYHIFVPADNDGIYWTRWSLNWPSYEIAYRKIYPESEVWYGKVYEGQTQAASEATKSSGWSSYQLAAGWQDQYAWLAGKTLTFTIPVTHNRIHVWLVHGCGIVSFTLDGGTTGLDVNTIDTSSIVDGVVQEHIVATSAAGTTFVITTVDANKNHAVIGITTYDDDKLGNPATASGGIATGHNLITQFKCGSVCTYMQFQDIGFAKKLLAESALDTVLAWAPTGQTKKWTTYGIHSNEYPFVATMQPTLYVDGVSQGEMWDVVNNVALGELHEANDISCIVEGFGDFDSDGVEDTDDVLKMRVTYNFTPTGFGLITGIKWTGSADVNTGGIFGSTLPLTVDMSGNIRFLPDRTNVVIGSAYTNKQGNGVYVYPTGIDCIIHATSSGPISSMYEQATSHKMYFDLNLLLLEGGIAPVNGDAWPMGMHIDIKRTPYSYQGCYDFLLAGDLNDDCRVDFYDFAKMAENWLIDCMTDPNDPACVLK